MALALVKGTIIYTVIIVAAICFYHYLLYPGFNSFLDFGGGKSWRYHVNVSDLMENNITKEDSLIFYNHFFPNINNIIYTEIVEDSLPEKMYNVVKVPTKGGYNDSIIWFKLISKIQNASGDKMIYFVEAMGKNKDIRKSGWQADYYDEFHYYSERLAIDTRKRIVKAIGGSPAPYDPKNMEDQKLIKVYLKDFIKHLIVDDCYYYDLPILKIKNPAFWDNVLPNGLDLSGDPIIGRF